jgi:flagellar biosynthesis protein FlhF
MNFRLTRFEAPTMTEALQKIRATLGTDAMIVSARTFRRGGVLGVGGQEVVEVYAADTRSRIENIRRERSSRSRASETAPAAVEALAEAAAPAAESRKEPAQPKVEPRDGSGNFSDALSQIRQEIRDLMVRGGDGRREGHPFLRECYDLLVTREVDPQVAGRIVEQIASLRLPSGYPDPSRVRAVVRSQLTRLFLSSPPFDEGRRTKVIVLVGPTGVGKTTTIAKLAAKSKINERRSVGLITLDTFRIAAVDQLEKYARLIELPLIVATTPRELEAAVREFEAKQTDVVFIDSAGRSHRDEIKMAELREFLAVLPEAEIHLVVSTTTHGKTIQSIASRFASVGFHKVILTKVDETISFGSLVNALVTIGRPVSFVTDGQNVPDDIVVSDPERLAELVLKTNAL